MTKTIETLQAEYAAAKAASDAINAKHRAWTNVQNEGRDGYNPHEGEMMQAAKAAGAAKTALDEAKFWQVWTADVFAARRVAWNTAMMALPGAKTGRVLGTDMVAMEQRLGYTAQQMLKAKARYAA